MTSSSNVLCTFEMTINNFETVALVPGEGAAGMAGPNP